MTPLIPLAIAIPMVVAALMVAAAPLIPRQLADLLAIATASAVTAISALLLSRSIGGGEVYWFGGWMPLHGFAIGIPFIADTISAGLATLVATLTLSALVFSWHYFEAVRTLFHALMLIFMAAMIAFSLTGDIFNLFVFFELMSVAAYALTGYKIEEESALEGAINFAVTNSVGAFFVLTGIALLYGRTGTLNMAQIGRTLAGHPADGLVISALTFVVTGFLVKAAMVPFHFWLSDAHAVAPTPVCVLFSGVMVELGLYAVVRVYWVVFSGVSGIENGVSALLITFGVFTALLGAVMCLLQRHLKRLLAFSTISHVGIFIIGAAALSPIGLAGSGLYIIGHGLMKGALFICAGVILNEAGTVDEFELLSKRIGSRILMVVYTAAALGLSGMPPFTTAMGKSLVERSFHGGMETFMSIIALISSGLTGGAVLRAGGRIFFGWGTGAGEERESPTEQSSESETIERPRWIPLVMIAPAAGLLAVGVVLGLSPGLAGYAAAASAELQNRVRFASLVLDGHRVGALRTAQLPHLSHTSAIVGTILAIGVALFELFAGNLPAPVSRLLDRIVILLDHLHSGQIGDYVTWVVVGVSIFGAALMANFLLVL